MRRAHLLAFIVYFVAITARLLPLLVSGLPYNIDGFSVVRIAEDVQATGHIQWDLADPNLENVKVPVFAVLLHLSAAATGMPPLAVAQLAIAVIGAISVLAAFVLVRRLTGSDPAAAFASLFLALNGLYVFFTATTIKASIGFALLPIILLLYWEREDPRKRLLAVLLLVTLPLTHHLTSLIVFSMISMILFVQLVQWWQAGTLTARRTLMELSLGPALILPGILYYRSVSLGYWLEVNDPRHILLFLSVTFLAALVVLSLSLPARSGPWFFLRRKRRLWSRIFDEKLIYPVGAIVLLLVNERLNIFAGTIRTKPGFMTALIPYIVLMMVCLIGFNVIRHTRSRFRPLAAAAFVAPFSVMVFAFLRGLDPFSFPLMYRSYDYMDLALALFAGVGMAFLVSVIRSKAVRVALIAGFAILLVLTLPLGFNSEEYYDVQNFTYEYEFAAMTHLNSLGPSYAGTDQRLFATMSWYYHQEGDGALPPIIAREGSTDRYDFLLLEGSWARQGAQLHPAPNLVLGADTLAGVAAENDAIYSVVGASNDVTILKTR
jgi:hypothetical protein